MFRKPIRLSNYSRLKAMNERALRRSAEQENAQVQSSESKPSASKSPFYMTKEIFNRYFSKADDLVLKEIPLNRESGRTIYIAYAAGLTDTDIINEHIVKPLICHVEDLSNFSSGPENSNGRLIQLIKDRILTIGTVEEVTDLAQSFTKLLSGDTLLFVDGEENVLSILSRGWKARGVEQPETEAVVRGPREGFNESIFVNIALIRRRIRTSDLKFELLKLGERSKTDVAICYIEGIAHKDIVDMVRQRLAKIKIDAVLESGYIEEFMEDAPYSIFPTIGNTERPDRVAGKILEGRVAILVDGTPYVLTVPYLFIESLQATEDYYSKFYFSSVIRLIRLLALFVSTTFPALYVALICFHRDVIPMKLLLTMMSAREGIPFSPVTEALILGVIFEILREAGVRMPRAVGQAVSIVGALVLGQALIDAGLASASIIIVTATTAITSFIVSPMNGAMPIIRAMTLISANVLGLTGILLTWIMFLLHMCSLKSFGIPYLAPIAPLNDNDLKDIFLRFPLWTMLARPKSLTWGREDNRMKYRMDIDELKEE